MTTRQARRLGLLTTPDAQPRQPNARREAAESLPGSPEQDPITAALAEGGANPERIQEIQQDMIRAAQVVLDEERRSQRSIEVTTIMQQARDQPGVPIRWHGRQLSIEMPRTEHPPRPAQPAPAQEARRRPVSPTVQQRQAQQVIQAMQAMQAIQAIRAAVDLTTEALAQDQVVPEQRPDSPDPLPNVDDEVAVILANLGENMHAGAEAVDIIDMANIVFGNHDDIAIQNNVMGEQEIIHILNNPHGQEEENEFLLGDEEDEVREVFNRAQETRPISPNFNDVGQPEDLMIPEGIYDFRNPIPGRRDHVRGVVQNMPARGRLTHYVPNPYGNRHHQITIELRGIPPRSQRSLWIQHPMVEVAYRMDLRELHGEGEQRDEFVFYPHQPRRDDENQP